MKRRLSIIMPCIDEAATIVGALEALQPFVTRGAEVIVIDGGSTDDTVALALSRGARVLQAPRGRSVQMNRGAAAARGDVLLFLHADTRLPPDADRLIAEALSENGRSWGRFDVKIIGEHVTLRVVAALMNLRSRLTGIATGDQAMFVERVTFEALGGYREMPLMEDIDLSARLRERSRPVCVRAKAVTSGRRWERGGIFRTILLMWRLRLAYWRGVDPRALAVRYDVHR